MATKSELLAAYRATTYRVFFPDAVCDLRLDQTSEKLRQFLDNSGVLTFAILTAYNPASSKFDDASNERLQTEIEQVFKREKRLVFPGENRADDEIWPIEKSCCVLGLSLLDACELGARYGQNAIVFGGVDAIPRLYWIKETE